METVFATFGVSAPIEWLLARAGVEFGGLTFHAREGKLIRIERQPSLLPAQFADFLGVAVR